MCRVLPGDGPTCHRSSLTLSKPHARARLAAGIAVVVRDTPLVKSGVIDGPTCYRSSLTLSKPHARTPLAAGIVVVVRDPPLVKRGVWSPAVGYTAGLVVPGLPGDGPTSHRSSITLSKPHARAQLAAGIASPLESHPE